MLRIEQTAEDEVCVTVEPTDQQTYGIRYETMSFSDLHTRRFCERIALLISSSALFTQRECDRLTVRAVRQETGDLTLFFTFPGPESSEACYCSQMLEFSTLDALLDCRAAPFPLSGLKTEIYQYGKRFFLWLEGDLSPVAFASLVSVLTEYGTPTALDCSFLREHGISLSSGNALLFRRKN